MNALSLDEYVTGVLGGDRTVLARAITRIESTAERDREGSQALLNRLLPYTGRAFRIGITGSPGVGKSTFIEAFGAFLCGRDLRVAVLAVDPSSRRTGGSILGDKTRMDRLSRDPRAFIRPSPSGETLGGVARRTRESGLVCEAAGFDVVIIETVGVGQNEIAVRSMVDFFLLVLQPGAGDELQGIKKGIVELADALFINKDDGDGRARAERTRAEYEAALRYVAPATPSWETRVLAGSALEDRGMAEAWALMETFRAECAEVLRERRSQQALNWLSDLVLDELHTRFYRDEGVRALMPAVEDEVLNGRRTAASAAAALFERYDRQKEKRP